MKKKGFMPSYQTWINPETGKRERLPAQQNTPFISQQNPAPVPAPAPAPALAPAPEPDFTEENRDTWAVLASYMRSIGLGSLMQVDANGNPSGWLYDAVVDGVNTTAELLIRLESTQEFRNRFNVIIEQQRRAANGEDVYVMTPEDVLNYEAAIDQTFSRVGMPDWFMNNRRQLDDLILSGVSAEDVAQKVDVAFSFVDSAPPEVRDAFAEFYGANSDAALAAYILDSDMTIQNLERAQRTAYVAGMGARYDVGVSRSVAENLAELPLSEEGIIQGMETIARQADVFAESVGEAQDLTASETGIAAEFGGDANAVTAIERRLAERSAVRGVSVGGALLTQQGVTGLS